MIARPVLDFLELYVYLFFPRQDDFAYHTGFGWLRAGRPITPRDVDRSFRTGPSLSAYMVGLDGLTHVLAVDFDTPSGYDRARLVGCDLWAVGVPAYIEQSREGRAHLFVTLDRRIPASYGRRLLIWVLAARGLQIDHLDDLIEVRPASDRAPSPGGAGKGMRAPMMPNPKTGRRYVLEDPRTGQPLGDGTVEGAVRAVEQASAQRVVELAGPDPEPERRSMGRGWGRIAAFNALHTIIELLREIYGIDVEPDSQIRCTEHDDRTPSAHVYGDRRVVCFVPGCALNNEGRGLDAWGLAQLVARKPKAGR